MTLNVQGVAVIVVEKTSFTGEKDGRSNSSGTVSELTDEIICP